MASTPTRDPASDHLLTPQNAALLLIDYQPSQLENIHSMDRQLLLKNAVSTVKLAKAFNVPIVHSTINVASGQQKPSVPELAAVLGAIPAIARTGFTSAWAAVFLA